MRDVLLTLVMLAGLGSVPLQGAHYGIILWHVFSLMNPHRLAWGFAASLPWGMAIAVVTIGTWMLPNQPKRFVLSRSFVLLLLLMLWVTITTITARNGAMALAYWEQTIKVMVMAAITIPIMAKPQRLRALVWAAAVAIGFYGVKGGLFSLATAGSFRVLGPPDTFIADNNALALALVMTIPLLAYLAMTADRRHVATLLWVSLALTTVAAIFTYSRGGFIGLVACYGLLLLRSRHRVLAGAMVVLLLVLAVPLLPDKYIERIGTIQTYEQDGSAMSRIAMWQMALRIAADSPIVGGGFKVFVDPTAYTAYFPEADVMRDVHSSYFQMLGEHGYVGLLVFLALGLSVLADCVWVRRRTRRRPDLQSERILATMLMISLCGYAASGTFLTLAFYDYLYLEVAMVIILRRVVAERLRQPAGAAPAPVVAARRRRGYWPAPPRPEPEAPAQSISRAGRPSPGSTRFPSGRNRPTAAHCRQQSGADG